MEVKTLDVFGKLLFGTCAIEWLSLCKEQKKEWILKRTKQTDIEAIMAFINNPNISKECKCLDCGKTKKNGNNTNGISEEVATVIEPTKDSVDNGGNSVERPKTVKKRKNK